MSARVQITFACSGCDAVHDAGSHLVRRQFRSFSGRDYGVGTWQWIGMPEFASLFPADWEKDTLTGADYCPKCAAEVWPITEVPGFGQLAYRERRCLELEQAGKTVDEIAATFQVTPERISQIIDQSRKVLAQVGPNRGHRQRLGSRVRIVL